DGDRRCDLDIAMCHKDFRERVNSQNSPTTSTMQGWMPVEIQAARETGPGFPAPIASVAPTVQGFRSQSSLRISWHAAATGRPTTFEYEPSIRGMKREARP